MPNQGKEEVVLTFLSEAEIREQVTALCHRLNLQAVNNINQSETVQLFRNNNAKKSLNKKEEPVSQIRQNKLTV